MTTAPPKVSVLALCYNHARFVEACLESIRAQTFQDFELIVTDDASSDESPSLITSWLARYYPSARFIRHSRNVGLCKTLNEALSHARGRYISMIATDDTWEPTKLARQYAAIEACPSDVAMVYADAFVMDEEGNRVGESFLEAHGVTDAPPRGDVFSRIADGNFIPAMATLIRLDALRAARELPRGFHFHGADPVRAADGRARAHSFPDHEEMAGDKPVDRGTAQTLDRSAGDGLLHSVLS